MILITPIKFSVLLFATVFVFGSLCICSANSAEPPGVIIAVPRAPDDLELAVIHGKRVVTLKKEKRLGEISFIFLKSYFNKYENIDYHEFLLSVKTRGYEKQLPLKDFGQLYNGYITLDIESMTMTQQKSPLRSATLVGLRMMLTLLFEGGVFLLFGFREKRSWVVFIAVNLVTQGALNLWINGYMNVFSGYNISALVFVEKFIVAAELCPFIYLLREKTKKRRTLYVFVANLTSLLVGGWLISILPV